MSTRSTINIKNEDGTIDGIYCHYDGFPDNNGKMLLQHYDSEEKVKELINLGDISFLGPTLNQNDTKSYHRDDGDDIQISMYANEDSVDGADYNYLWKDGMWWMSEWAQNKWIPLDQIIMEAKSEKFYPPINEEVKKIHEEYSPEWFYIQAEDAVPTRMKKSFRDVVHDIQTVLQREEAFTEIQIEDYLKHLIEEFVT